MGPSGDYGTNLSIYWIATFCHSMPLFCPSTGNRNWQQKLATHEIEDKKREGKREGRVDSFVEAKNFDVVEFLSDKQK